MKHLLNIKISRKILLAAFCTVVPCCVNKTENIFKLPYVVSTQEIVALFPTSVVQIDALATKAVTTTRSGIEKIVSLPNDKRTFTNTLGDLDILGGNLSVAASVLGVLTMVSPDEALRQAAERQSIVLQNFVIEHISHNKKLYQAVKYYAEHTAPYEKLSQPERYLIEQALKGYEHSGVQLPDDQQDTMKKIQAELGVLELEFDKNIASDNKTITVSQKQLAGVPSKLIDTFDKTPQGNYKVGVDYPTYTAVMENCTVESTRKALWQAFSTRGYPANRKILDRVVALRTQLAHILNFKDYAHLDIDGEMAQTPEKVAQFLKELVSRCEKKVEQELAHIKTKLPGHIKLQNGKFQPWDRAWSENYYKKQYLAVDETKIAKFFPLEHTLDKLLHIYEEFFGLTFKKEPVTGLWHTDVELVKVYKNSEYIGAVVLDVFPRPHKYSHACQASIVPGVRAHGKVYPSVIVVIANFPKPTPTCQALLKRGDVITFFHEFGHALHSLLGITQLAGFSGAHVKTDFVEMPSQMLEQWMWDSKILKIVSKHYKTGQPLSDDLIAGIEKVKNFNEGDHIQGQLFYSFFALELFSFGNTDCDKLWQSLHKKLRPNIVLHPESKGYASFGHLMGYGAKYYGYLWSKVYALDLFAAIKQAGLLNRAMGEKYTRDILAPGGSQEPLILLQNFLGRPPNSDAFFKDLGV